MRTIRDIVDQILLEMAEDPRSQIAFLQARWSAVVGEAMAGSSRPVAYEQGCLVVEVEDSHWIEACQEKAEIIRRRVQSLLRTHRIRRVAFRPCIGASVRP